MTVYLLALMRGILIRLKICIGFLSLTNVTLEGHDIFQYVVQIHYTDSNFIQVHTYSNFAFLRLDGRVSSLKFVLYTI